MHVELLVLAPKIQSQFPAPLSQRASGSIMTSKAGGVTGKTLGLRGRFTTFPNVRGMTNHIFRERQGLSFFISFFAVPSERRFKQFIIHAFPWHTTRQILDECLLLHFYCVRVAGNATNA